MFGAAGLGMMLVAPFGAVVEIVRSCGSIRIVPGAPCGAPVSAVPVSVKPCWPDSSIVPPSPPCLPPRALIAPPACVSCVLSTLTWPPLPAPVASARMRAPLAIAVRVEAGAVTKAPPRARARVVPIATVPPPARPDALMRALAATCVAPSAITATWPPTAPGARPSAARRPSTTTEPPVPVTSMRPVWPPSVFA